MPTHFIIRCFPQNADSVENSRLLVFLKHLCWAVLTNLSSAYSEAQKAAMWVTNNEALPFVRSEVGESWET